jgi:hypothetical protein
MGARRKIVPECLSSRWILLVTAARQNLSISKKSLRNVLEQTKDWETN